MTNEFFDDTDLSFLDCVEFEEDTPAPSRGKSTAKVREFLGLTFTMTQVSKGHSKESRDKMSAAKLGKKRSDESRTKMTQGWDLLKESGWTSAHKGMKRSDETRARMSQAQSKPVMTPLGEFANCKAAAEAYGLKSKEAILYRMKSKPSEYYYI